MLWGNEDEWIAPWSVNDITFPKKIDTGSKVNILPIKYIKKLSVKPKMRPKKMNL